MTLASRAPGTTADPTVWLAHRPPFLLVDTVEVVEAGRRATGLWTPGEERFAGHFPGRPLLAGVLQVEAIAQVGACALLAGAAGETGHLPVFRGLERVRWRRHVVPGDTLEMDVELDAFRHGLGRGRGRACVGGAAACEARLLFALLPPGEGA